MESLGADSNSLDFESNADSSSCMSDATTETPRCACDHGVQFDFDAVRAEVESLLADLERMAAMSPLDHLEWALMLPTCAGLSRPPGLLGHAVHTSDQMEAAKLDAFRHRALDSWLERKRVLDPPWHSIWLALPPHVRAVLGPKKNILLLRELLCAAGYPHDSLVDDLLGGFALIGELPRSGTLPEADYPLTSETRESLLESASQRNYAVLHRVATSMDLTTEIANDMDRNTFAQVESKRAAEVSLCSVVEECVLTPRFPADEGLKLKRGAWKRSVRCIDDFIASRINAAVAPGETIHHDTLDVLVALLHQVGVGGRPVRFRKDDFVGAYKTLPLRSEDLELAVALWRDASNELRAVQLYSCPFGAVGNVYAWHRLGAGLIPHSVP